MGRKRSGMMADTLLTAVDLAVRLTPDEVILKSKPGPSYAELLVDSAGLPDSPMEQTASEDRHPLGLILLSLLALSVGIVTGFGAVGFRALIGLIHNMGFHGRFMVQYDANIFTAPSPWGVLVILVPVVGALGVTFLVSNFAPEAKGHGVPEVMDAVYYGGGVIRPVVAVVKSLASALAIGTGAAVGREGPIIQIGSALGSSFGQLIKMPPSQRITLVAAGAGAGIAATFNTPIGGVMFAVELMMPEVSATTFLPVALATGAATFVGRWFFGQQPAFYVPPLLPLGVTWGSLAILCLYALLGAMTGVAAAGFIRGLHVAEDLFDKIRNRYLRHVLGMLLVGILFYSLMTSFGHYYVEGVGYSTIQSILLGQMSGAWLLALLFVCKLLATSLSLGSGSSGGIFSPSLFMGATIGAALAGALHAAGLPLDVSIPVFAMVGMGAMVGGGTGAAMTAVTMIFEMTRTYDIVMPMIIAVAVSVGVRRLLSRENIYTHKLVKRGHAIPKALHVNMFFVRRAGEVMDTEVAIVDASSNFDEFLADPSHHGRLRHVVVMRGERIFGVVRVNTALRRATQSSPGSVTFEEIASRMFTLVYDTDVVFDVIQRMTRKRAVMAVVLESAAPGATPKVIGVITKEHIADSVASTVTIYPD